MHFNILTLFPELFPGALGHSVTGRALSQKIWDFSTTNIRDFATDNHKTVDDAPFGGGAGMVMKPDVLERAILSIPDAGRKIYLSPRGKVLNQNLVKELATEKTITLLCGRYEGVDQRLLESQNFEEISIGDYVLTGGEMAAHILMDTCIRLLDGAVGNADTPVEESFSDGLLEYPHYTRPAEWIDTTGTTRKIPDILTSGHHENIRKWRHEQSLTLTRARRPDLLKTD